MLASQDNQNIRTLWNRGWAEYEKANYDTAIKTNLAAIESKEYNPRFAMIKLNLALCYLAKNDTAKAAQYYQQAIEENQKNDRKLQKHNLVAGLKDLDEYLKKAGLALQNFSSLRQKFQKVSVLDSDQNLESFADSTAYITVKDWKYSNTPKINDKPVSFGNKDEIFQSVDILGMKVVLGSSWYIYCCDSYGKQLWRVPVQGSAWAVNISGNGKFVVAAIGDGTIRWYNLSDGRHRYSLFVHADSKRWVLWTPDGYYDCSSGGESLIGWQLNEGDRKASSYHPAQKYKSKYYRPEVIETY